MKTPILHLSEREVRGILDGTITRVVRPIKPQPEEFGDGVVRMGKKVGMLHAFCPFPKGSIVCGKEAWGMGRTYERGEPEGYRMYKADDPTDAPWEGGWRSPATMPQWASRIWLEVVHCHAAKGWGIYPHACSEMGMEPVMDVSSDTEEALANNWFRNAVGDLDAWYWSVKFRRVEREGES